MSAQDIDRLVDFGLSSLQSRVYVILLQLGTSRASQVSSAVGIVRPEGYRILRELAHKGLVQRNPAAPSTYTAVPPNRALSLLLHRYETRLGALKKERTVLLKSLTSCSPSLRHTSSANFSLITGGGNTIYEIRKMVASARNDYAAIMSKHHLRRIQNEKGSADAIVSAARRKASVRIITEIDDSNAASADYLSRYVELRRNRDLLFCIDIVDKKQMILGPPVADDEAGTHSAREVDVWTDNPEFVLGMYALFERLWKASPRYVPRSREHPV